MKNSFTTTIIVDQRYPRKKDGRCPVKLRVIINRKARYYGIDKYLYPEELTEKIYTSKPKGEYKKLLKLFTDIQNRADIILEALENPSFDQFKRLFTQKGGGGNVRRYYDSYIAKLKEDNQHTTASTYLNAMNSLDATKGIEKLNFRDITPEWLKDYQKKMLKDGRSVSTISIYLRTLRTLFNRAIDDGVVSKSYYPFGRGKYQVPSARNNKRPLERWEIQTLAEYRGNEKREMYRDFFLLSYSLMGLNFADLLSLKWDNIKQTTNKDDGQETVIKYLQILRKKTANTSLSDQYKIEIIINEYAQRIIDKYGKGGKYIFSIMKPNDSEEEKIRKIKSFVRNCNQALKKIAKQTGINNNISTMFARHSAAVHGLEGGATIGDVSHALGHKDLKTTSNYITSLEGGKRKLSDALKITVPEQEHGTNPT